MKISIHQAVKQFGTVQALADVSLEIADGELFFLLGPSGCGKTTLLRTLAGFYELDSGTLAFDGRDMAGVPPHKRNTGMMFQGYALWPHMTVLENVLFGLEMRGLSRPEREKKARGALERVRIADLAERKPHQLSGGQQQRVALARTLVVEPAVLLLDEPLANLDAKLRLEMRTEIRRLCKDTGLTAVYVTHDQKEALAVADRLAIMHQGRLLQAGEPRHVYRRPVSAFVAEFIGETNFLPGTVGELHPDDVCVETACGRLRAAVAPAGLTAGANVLLSLRPEAFQVRRGADAVAAAAVNGIAGTVTETTYLGGMAQYRVAVGGTGAAVLSVLEVNPPETSGAASLVLTIAPADVVILPA